MEQTKTKTRRFLLPAFIRWLLGTLVLIAAVWVGAAPVAASTGDVPSYNYILTPPADQAGGGAGQGGTRIQFGMDNKLDRLATDPGTSVGYIPYQFLVASSQPQARFQMRGGRWDDSGGTHDWYDFASGNPGWVINDFIKKRGLLSPIYYEVYQLWGDNAQAGGTGGNGQLLGVINPRDGNIFPSTDQNPGNDNCGAWGCWRQFDTGTGGGNITLDGSQQDSCSKRLATHSNQCYPTSIIAMAEDSPNSHALASAVPTTIYRPTWDNGSMLESRVQDALTSVRIASGKTRSESTKTKSLVGEYGSNVQDFFLGTKASAFHIDNSTHSITVNVNPLGRSPGKVTAKVSGGNCTGANGNQHVVGPDGSVTFGGCPTTGHSYTAEVLEDSFEFDNGTCSIGPGAKSQSIGGAGSATFTYDCYHRIRVWVNPRARSGIHVTVRLRNGDCTGANGNQARVVDGGPFDGSVQFSGCPDKDNAGNTINYTAEDIEDQFYDDQGNYYCKRGGNAQTVNVGNDAEANLWYDCYQAFANDGGLMSQGHFNGVNAGARFNSSTQPNLNGNYVFLIKVVNYADIGSGYVTTYDRLTGGNGDAANCPLTDPQGIGVGGNRVVCPTDLFQRAQHESTEQVVRDGFYLRAPRLIDNNGGTRQYLATAPSRISFGINYGSGTGGESHYGGVNFAGGGTACRTPYPGDQIYSDPNQNPPNIITTADWDKNTTWWTNGFDNNIWANINRIGWRDDRGNLYTDNPAVSQPGFGYPNLQLSVPPPSANWMPANDVNAAGGWENISMINKGVGIEAISGSWQSSTVNNPGLGFPLWAFEINDPGRRNQINPFLNNGVEGGSWGMNDSYAGQMPIYSWDYGNLLLMGGQAFTTGFWPTCRPPNPTPLTPKSYDGGYKYDGQDSYTPVGSDVDARLNFNFDYNLPEFRPQVDWRVDVSTNSSFSGVMALQSSGTDTNVEAPGSKSAPINTNSLLANTDYYWRGCINDKVHTSDFCTSTITKFRVNKGPKATVVSADPNNPTDSGNVNWNCSKLAMRLDDPENGTPTGSQVRPYFTVSWTDASGNINRVQTFDRSSGNSDTWGNWVTDKGYRASGSTFTSDEVKPKVWTVNGVARSVPNETLTQFIQSQDVPEGSNLTWIGQGEDQFGASDVGTSTTDPFYYLNSTPLATFNAGYGPDQQYPLGNRRFGAPVSTNMHKNTRPNLNTATTKKFKDFSGAPITNVTDGQTIQVETRIVNGGETPTKSYQVADYLGSVRDFEPPITNDPSQPITLAYDDGTPRTIAPTISTVIPNHQNGALDQPETPGNPTDDRQASYKLDLGANTVQGGSAISINGKDFASCAVPAIGGTNYCLTNDAQYPNAVYWISGGHENNIPNNEAGFFGNAQASYRFSTSPTGTYDLTLQYFNHPGSSNWPNPGSPIYPPSGYSYHIKVDYPGGSKTVNLPIESTNASQNLHTYTVNNLNITGANPTVTVTWDNNYWRSGLYDANFGLNSLQLKSVVAIPAGTILRPGDLNPGESITLDYWIRANRNHDTINPSQGLSPLDQNNNFQRRYGVGSTPNPQPAPQPDPGGGTIDVGDAHIFLPFSEDYCNTANPLVNHTCEFKPGDILAPWLRTQRGAVGSNGGVFGYDALAGNANATFLVQANGTISHFTSSTATLPNYTSQQAVCTAQGERPGGLDWRRTMIANINSLNNGSKNTTHTNTGPLLNPGNGAPRGQLDGPGNGRSGNVWVIGSPTSPEDLTIDNQITFDGVGTILVFGNLTLGPNAKFNYANTDSSLGVIVVGNLTIDPAVTDLVGSYYVLDSQPSVDANGCPVGIDPTKTNRGRISTGNSSTRLNVQGLMVAGAFDFLRYFTDPSDSQADPAENIYYDGRVLSHTPPGFGTFRNTSAWYEIAP